MEELGAFIIIIIYIGKLILHYLTITEQDNNNPSIYDFLKKLFMSSFSLQFYFPFYFKSEYEYINLKYQLYLKIDILILWIVFILYEIYIG